MKIVVSADGLTPEDFTHSGCDEALAAHHRRWNSDCLMALGSRREAAQAEGDQRTVTVCLLLHAVLASRTPWSQAPLPDEDDPLLPTFELDDGAFAYLGQILGLIADAEMRARAADLLYQRSVGGRGKRDITAAEIAVHAYLAEAARHENSDDGYWFNAEKRVERSFCIAAELQHRKLKKAILDHIERALVVHTTPSAAGSQKEGAGGVRDASPSRYPAVLMRLLIRFKEGEPLKLGPLSEQLAHEALAASQWEMGREYLDVAAEWHRQADDPVHELLVQEWAAESWVSEGEKLVERADTAPYWYLLAEHRLGRGIEVFRTVAGRARECSFPEHSTRLKARTEEVRRLHLQYQERGVAALVPIQVSETIDSGPIFAVVEGKSKMEALYAMTTFRLESRTKVEDMVRDENENNPLLSIFGLAQLDERGRNTARTDSRAEADLWARVCQRVVMLYEMNAQIYVGPLIWRVGLDHAVDARDFLMLAHASQFVPAGRESLFARGFHAGMQSDFDLAIHLLVPQVEHAAREIVRAAISADERLNAAQGKILEDPDAPSLNQVLCDSAYSSELSRVIGTDAVFALRVILVERFGGNLRNRTLHGLVGNGGSQVWLCWYFWWLIMKICWATAVVTSNPDE